MKKIVIMHPELCVGGAEKVLLNMLKVLPRNKYEVTLLLRNPSLWDEKVPADVRVRYFFQKDPRKCGGLWARVYKYAIIICPRLCYKLWGVNEKFDIAIAYHEPMLWFLKEFPATKMCWVHTDYAALEYCPEVKQMKNKTGMLARYVNNKRNKIIRSFDKAVFVAQSAIPEYVRKTGIDPQKTVVCYNLNDENMIREKAAEKISDDEWNEYKGKRLCAVGRLADEKAFHRMIPLMKELQNKNIDAKLFIIGEGNRRPLLEKLIAENDLHNLVLLGHRENPYKYIANSDLLICSSAFEAYCTVTKESIILHTPFITTECSGMHEQIGDTCAGAIVPNADDTLFPIVYKALTDDSFYKKMKEDVTRRAEAFTDQKALEAIEKLLDERTGN